MLLNNFICLPCKSVTRGKWGIRCKECNRIMMKVNKTPKQNSKYWKSKELKERWLKDQRSWNSTVIGELPQFKSKDK